MIRPALLAAVSLLAGCGTLTFDELGPFGRLASTDWLVLQAPEGDTELLVVSNVGDVCGRLGDEIVEFTDAWDDWEADVGEAGGDDDRVADATERFLDRALEATRRLDAADAAYLVLDPLGDTPEEGDVVVPDDLVGTLVRFEENPYRKAADEADPADTAEVLDRLVRASDAWGLVDGTATFQARGDDARRVRLDAALQEEDGDDAGTISLDATFRRCEVTVPGGFRLPF